MTSPALVLLIVLPAAATAPSTIPDLETMAMERAIHQVAEVQVDVQTRPSFAQDDELLHVGRKADATFVAEVTWAGPDRTVARLHAYSFRASRWIEHTLEFGPGDAPEERARAVGFAIASLLPMNTEPQPPVSSQAPPAALPAPATATVPVDTTPTNAHVTGPAAQQKTAVRGALDATLQGASAIGGDGGGYGAGVGASLPVSQDWAARLGFAARFGNIDAATATTSTLIAELGIRYEHDLSKTSLVGGVGLDALLVRYEIGHFSSDDTSRAREATFSPGVAATLEPRWRLGPNADALLRVGGEAVFSRGRVYVAGQERTTVEPLRLVGGFGLRVRF